MSEYSVSVIFDACKSVKVEAGSAQEAAEIAYDEAGYASLCHQCSGEIDVADAVRAIVYDESGDEVFDDGYENGLMAKLEPQIKELRQERQREHDMRVSLAGELEVATQNARDLFAALELSVQLMDRFGEAYGCEPSNYIEYKAAKAAIAKAKGGAV